MGEISKITADYKRIGKPILGSTNAVKEGIIKLADATVTNAKVLAPVDFAQMVNGVMYKTFYGDEGGFNERRISNPNKRLPEKEAKKEISRPTRAFTAHVGLNVEHAIYQEFGTRYHAPQPFLRPAIAGVVKNRNIRKEVARLTNKNMKDALKKGQVKIFSNIQSRSSFTRLL